MTDQTRNIVERLRRVEDLPYSFATSGTSPVITGMCRQLINPDGPDAADHIEALTKRVAELEGWLERIRDFEPVESDTGPYLQIARHAKQMARASLSSAAPGD